METSSAVDATQQILRGLCGRLTTELDAAGAAVSRIIGDVLVQIAEDAGALRTLALGRGYLVSDFPLTQAVLGSGEPRSMTLGTPGADPAEAELLEELGFASLLMLRLDVAGTPWALVEIFGRAGRSFSAADAEHARVLVRAGGAELDRLRSGSR